MALTIRIGSRQLRVVSAKISETLSAVPEFEATVLHREVTGQDYWGEDAALIEDGVELITGIVYDGPIAEMDENGVAISTIYCYGELGRLMNLGAFSKGHYQEQAIISILGDLLNVLTDDWKLGNVSTMINPLVQTTIDLRPKETRWAQVVETVRSVSRCSVRYGGFDAVTGRYMIDIGAFGELIAEPLIDGKNIVRGTLKQVRQQAERLRVLEGYGGKAGDVIVSLEHAQGYNNELIGNHPQYPVRFQGVPNNPERNWYTCTDLSVDRGVTRRRDFNVYRTQNDTEPSLEEILAAGFALWQRCVREFERNKPAEIYSCEAILAEHPAVGSTIRLKADHVERSYDMVTQLERIVPAFSVDGVYFISEYSLKLDDDVRVYHLTLTDSPYEIEVDDNLQVYERLENYEKFSSIGLSPFSSQIAQVAINHNGVASDCTANTNPGKVFNVPLPAIPPGATSVFYTYTTDPASDVQVTVTQVPTLSLPLIACVQQNDDWTLLSDVTLTVIYIFT